MNVSHPSEVDAFTKSLVLAIDIFDKKNGPFSLFLLYYYYSKVNATHIRNGTRAHG